EIESVLARNVHPDKVRKQRRKQHTVNDAISELCRCSVHGIKMKGIEIAAQRSKVLDILLCYLSLNFITLANGNIGKVELRHVRVRSAHIFRHRLKRRRLAL